MFLDVRKNHNNLPILYINDKPLHSIRDPYRDTKLLELEQQIEEYLLIGVGLGYVLDSFIGNKKNQKTPRIVLFFENIQEKEFFLTYQDLLGWGELSLTLFLFSEESLWASYLQESRLSKVKVWLHPYYHQIMQQTPVETFYKKLQQFIKQSLMNQITDVAFGFRWWRNFLRNYALFPTRIFKPPIDKLSTPVLIIGSGFTAYQYINKIQENVHNYFIIAIPPVLDLLLSVDIIPDIVVITDGGAANRFYHSINKLKMEKTHFITYPHIHTVFFHWIHPQNISLVNSGLELELLLTQELYYFPSGGSVGSTAFDIAQSLSHQVYYIGFDFTYTQRHPHYPGSPLESQLLFLSHRFCCAETQFTTQIYKHNLQYKSYTTSPVLKAYGEYFQQQITRASRQQYNIQDFSLYNLVNPIVKQKPNFNTSDDFSSISIQTKKQRLKSLKDILEISLQEERYTHPILKFLLAKSQIKSENEAYVIKQEIDFLEKLMQKIS